MRYGIVVCLLLSVSTADAHARHHHVNYSDGRPSAWCGWAMRHWLGVTDTAYNLARNWAHYGSATNPHVGAVVVWPHHVGIIVGQQNGQWVIKSGNDGHAVRERPRSIAGAIAIREAYTPRHGDWGSF